MSKIGIISDIHYNRKFSKEIKNELERVSKSMKKQDVNHLYILGDLILEDSAEEDIESIERVSTILESTINCTYLCGNHDLINISRPKFLDSVGQEETYGINHHGDFSVVYLDSVVKGEHFGRLSQNQIKISEQYCNENNKLVFLSHHPLKKYNLTGNKWFMNEPENALCRNYYDFYERINFDKTISCVSGHIHQESTERDLTNWYSVQAFARRIPYSFVKSYPSPPVTGAYAVAEIEDGNIDLRQYY